MAGTLEPLEHKALRTHPYFTCIQPLRETVFMPFTFKHAVCNEAFQNSTFHET